MSQSLKEDRLKKLQNFIDQGLNPYPSFAFEKDEIKQVLAKPVGEQVKVAGRLMLFRDMGKITFMHVQDESGRMQVVLNKNEFKGEAVSAAPKEEAKETDYKFWVKNLDLGDFIAVEGERFDTKKGEKSVLVEKISLLTKALRPLPDKHKALQNEEQRLRKRYLDILMNPETREIVYKRERFWSSMREFMQKKGFLEVETPVLETVCGGADANPFVTHHKAQDLELYLRISMGELWQKRLMVAGLEKTFEIGRQFRNEGMDAEHLQDYTQMEFYWAYADFKKGMQLVKELYQHVAKETFGTLKFKIRDFEVDLGAQWQEYDYQTVIKEETGVDILKADLKEITQKLDELGVKYDKKGLNLARAIDNLWKYCRKKICGPGFLVNEPVAVSPLAKRRADRPELTERFHVLIAGSELGNGYSELNDPIDQAGRFSEQQDLRDQGDEEAQMHDKEFIEALEYGMPPTCGFGLSERVFAFFMDRTAREAQIFPLMKPKE